jgi:hypothetical protein
MLFRINDSIYEVSDPRIAMQAILSSLTCIIVCEKSPSCCSTSLGASTQMSRLIASAFSDGGPTNF